MPVAVVDLEQLVVEVVLVVAGMGIQQQQALQTPVAEAEVMTA